MKQRPLIHRLLIAFSFVALAACTTGPTPSPSPAGSATPGTTPTPTAPPATSTPGTQPAPTGEPTPTGVPTPTTPPPTSSPAPTPDGTVTSAAEAAARVLATEPDLFYGIAPPRADLIGQCCWYQAHESVDHYLVTVEIGWGDCPSGCINAYNWLYRVDYDGTIALLEERGEEPAQRDDARGSGAGTVNIEALAGPVCPVEEVPADPACAPRPVAGAEVVVFDSAGNEIERPRTDEQGLIALSLPEGAYYLVPQPVEGLMGTPEPIAFSIAPGGELFLRADYDTGIR